MPFFNYTVTNTKGQKINGRIEAKDRPTLINTLRAGGFVIISITELKEKPFQLTKRRETVKLEDLVVFTRQLAALVKAGIPLVDGLNILIAQIENRSLKQIITSLVAKIESGSSLSEALSSYPNVFSEFYLNMIMAGELSGALDNILDRLALYLESANRLNRKVRSLFVYPTAVIAMVILITAVVFIKVIPGFKDVFVVLGTELPLPTRVVIKISDIFRQYFLYIALVLITLFILLKGVGRRPLVRLFLDRLKINLPVVGKVIQKIIIARFTRTLSTLLKSGVSILAAIEVGSKTSGNKLVESMLLRVAARVSKGEKIGESLAQDKIFAPLVVSLIDVGEETGDIPSMLDKIATFYEDEVDTAISGLTSLIEPVMIVFLGIVVGSIVIAMFLPILKLTQSVMR